MDCIMIRWTESEKVILKRIPKTEVEHRIQTEIEACKRLKDIKGVPKLHHFFEDESHFWLVFDLVGGTDLYSYLHAGKLMTEKIVKKIMKQLVRILTQLHSKGVVVSLDLCLFTHIFLDRLPC